MAQQSVGGDWKQEAGESFWRGVEQFNDGRFFEAHETWEEIWLASPEPRKTFLQGLIQVAAAFHHHRRGNVKGARSLLKAAMGRLEQFPAEYGGIALESLREAVRLWQSALAEKRLSGPRQPPSIRTVPAENAASRPSPRGRPGRH